jgi:hypothetical protein
MKDKNNKFASLVETKVLTQRYLKATTREATAMSVAIKRLALLIMVLVSTDWIKHAGIHSCASRYFSSNSDSGVQPCIDCCTGDNNFGTFNPLADCQSYCNSADAACYTDIGRNNPAGPGQMGCEPDGECTPP